MDKNDFKKQGFCTVLSLCVADNHPSSKLVLFGIIALVVPGVACIAVGFYLRYRRRHAKSGKSEFVFSLSVLEVIKACQ